MYYITVKHVHITEANMYQKGIRKNPGICMCVWRGGLVLCLLDNLFLNTFPIYKY
jgi:hypothetical protein